jgi:hypothetical protein
MRSESNQDIVAAGRVIYKINGLDGYQLFRDDGFTSSQLDFTFWPGLSLHDRATSVSLFRLMGCNWFSFMP